MTWLIDTNVLLRLADEQSPEHGIAPAATTNLLASGDPVFISAQVLVEFWAVATRPVEANGLGWTVETTAEVVGSLQEKFQLLNETPDALNHWLEVVRACQVCGKRAHDARLAALLLAHGIRRLVTFNTTDFPQSWGVDAVHPSRLLQSP